MANHLTPTEIAKLAGMERGEVLETCRRHSIPILHGRIDKSLFMLSVRRAGEAHTPPLR